MFPSTSCGDGVVKTNWSVKYPVSPLVACSFNFYLYIPVSYFALIVGKTNLHTLFDWISMFFFYRCTTKDDFITFLYVAVTCRAICL